MSALFKCLDICLSDFFQGHSNFVFAIPVSCETIYSDIIDTLETEYIEFDEYTGFTESDFNEALQSLKTELKDRLEKTPDVCKNIETDLDTESVFMYLTVEIDD